MPLASRSVRGGPLETVRCDLCGQGNDRTLLSLPDLMFGTSDQVFRLAKCRNCDLIYLNPRPQQHQMHVYYPDTYEPFSRQGHAARARLWLYEREVRELQAFLERPNRVVDVGCGNGDLLSLIRRAGNTNILGIEPSAGAAHAARDQKGLPIRTGSLENARLPDCSVDTVLLSHVLEHLPSPTSTLREIRRILKPGGRVILWVPNARSLAAQVLGSFWMGWDAPRHLYSFTPGTLHKLLAKADLLPAGISHEIHGLEWSWGLRLWAREHFESDTLNSALSRLHPCLALGLSPVGMLSALARRSGRIRLIARKPLE